MKKQILLITIGALISITLTFALTSLPLIQKLSLPAEHIKKAGELCWVGGANEVNMIDISNPSNPNVLKTWNTNSTVKNLFTSYYLYIAEYSNAVVIKDVNGAKSTAIGYLATGSQPSDVFVSGKHAFVTDMGTGLNIFDIGSPAQPKKLSTLSELSLPNALTVVGDYAYIAEGIEGLAIIDINDLEAPTEIGTYNTPGFTRDVKVDGNYAYLADDIGGVTILDISEPTDLIKTCELDITQANAIHVSGNYLYVATEYSGLRVFDISTPSNPEEVANFQTGGSVKDVFVDDTIIYLADQTNGLFLVNSSAFSPSVNASLIFTAALEPGWNLISLPNSPQANSVFALFPFISEPIRTYDEYAYISVSGLKIGKGYWVLSDSARTVTITGTKFSNYTKTLYPGWNMIGGLSNPLLAEVILSEPAIISDLYEYSTAARNYGSSDILTPGKAYWVLAIDTVDITISEYAMMGKVAVAGASLTEREKEYYFELYGYTPPTPTNDRARDESNDKEDAPVAEIVFYPNPVHSILNIDAPSDSKVEIYNLQGRKIASLERGANSWIPGSELESGTYLVRINTACKSYTRKICYLK